MMEPCRITIETPDGRMFQGVALDMQFEFRYVLLPRERIPPGFSFPQLEERQQNWYLSITGAGEFEFSPRREIVEEIKNEHQSQIEWSCDWCGSVNERAAKKCTQCGGYRSFLYEV